jgi:hypothetical protein
MIASLLRDRGACKREVEADDQGGEADHGPHLRGVSAASMPVAATGTFLKRID